MSLNRMMIADTHVMASPLPINNRWFSNDEDDLVVDWDSKGRVSNIKILELPIDHIVDEMLDTIYDWNRIYLAISNMSR